MEMRISGDRLQPSQLCITHGASTADLAVKGHSPLSTLTPPGGSHPPQLDFAQGTPCTLEQMNVVTTLNKLEENMLVKDLSRHDVFFTLIYQCIPSLCFSDTLYTEALLTHLSNKP